MSEETRKSIRHTLSFLDENPSEVEVISVSVEKIEPNEDNFYSKNENEIEDLSDSLRDFGQLSPIRVIKMPNGNYKLIDGEKRYHASKLAGIENLNAIEDDPSKSRSELKMILIQSNKYRDKTIADKIKELEEIEILYKELQNEGKLKGVKHRTFAAKSLGISETTVQNLNSLKKLIPDILSFFEEEKLSADRAYEIARMSHENQQNFLNQFGDNIPSLTVDEIKHYVLDVTTAPSVVITKGFKTFSTSIKKLTLAFTKINETSEKIDPQIISEYELLKEQLNQLEKLIKK